MQRKIFLSLLIVFSLVLVSYQSGEEGEQEAPKSEFINTLNDENFDSFLQANEFTLIKFFAPWCGHCKALAPQFIKAAETLAQTAPQIKLAEMDCTQSKAICGTQGIQGYPTIKLFHFDKFVVNYEEERQTEAIIKWLNKKTGDPIVKLTTKELIDQTLAEKDVVVVYFGKNEENIKILGNIALSNDDIVVGTVTDSALFSDYEVTKEDSIVLFKKFDEKRNNYEGDIVEENIRTFVNEKSVETVMKFSMKVVKKTFQVGAPFMVLFDKTKDTPIYEEFTKTAKSLKNDLVFSFTDLSDLGAKLAEIVGVDEASFPAIRIIVPGQNDLKKFSFSQEVTQENLVQFYQNFKDNKLIASVKSEDVPKEQIAPVFKLVGLNFEEVVIKSNKDVLVKFYAPWCGHCKALAPIFEELALKLKLNNVDNILIAEMDVTKNDVENIQIQSYPTIKFFPAKDKSKPIDFNKDRDLQGFLAFLKENASFDWVDIPNEVETVATPEIEKPMETIDVPTQEPEKIEEAKKEEL